MNTGLFSLLPTSRRRGGVPTWDGSTWRALPFAGARVARTADQTGIASGTTTYTAITFQSVNFDTHGYWGGADLNPTRITIPGGMGGYYEIGANIEWGTMTANVARLLVYRNGGAAAGGNEVAGIENRIFSVFAMQSLSTCYLLSQGDYLECYVSQDSGSNGTVRGTVNALDRSPILWLRRVGLDANPNPRQGG